MKFLLALVLALLAGPAVADGTVQVSSRTFYVGEIPEATRENPNFLPLDRIDWIQDFLDADPVMSRTVFHIFELKYDVRAAAASLDNVRKHENVEVQGRYKVQLPDDRAPEGFTAFATRLENPTSVRLVPKSTDIPFSVKCSYDAHMEKIHFCSANSSYSFDQFIALRSRLYFPGDYMENGEFFRDVA
ncbi:MAG: hypothetical protein WBV71_08750, partial [Roseobacter sp.]